MSIKKYIVRFVCLMLIFCTCLPLISCKKDGPSTDSENNGDENKKIITTAQNSDMVVYGNYIFLGMRAIHRYNRKTGELSKACRDIECNEKKCPIEDALVSTAGVYDGKLYFFSFKGMAPVSKIFIGYQDILSGDVTILKSMDADLMTLGLDRVYVDGGYVYYETTVLKEGGDKKNPNDYERSICRVSLDGKKDEVFIKLEENEGMAIVCDGKLIMASEGKLYSIDIETKEKNLLFDCETYDALNITSNIVYVNGKLYFTAKSKNIYTPEITGGECSLKILFFVDVNTGEVKKVIEEPVTDFTVANDAIYYVPFKYRILYMPEDYENNKDDLRTWKMDYTVYACDLDGKNVRAVYSNDKISCSRWMAVIGGVLYSYISDYDEEEHTYSSKLSFGAIDLETGKAITEKFPK